MQEIYLDAIIALVDAKHILKNLNEKKAKGAINEAQRQIALSDRIIINKKDLVSPQEIDKLIERIREVNPFSPIIQSEMAIVPLSQMLGINAYSVREPIQELQAHSEEKHSHVHSHHEKDHDDTVSTFTLESDTPVALDAFNTWIGSLLWAESSEKLIYRCKGVLCVENSEEKYSLQGVHTLFTVEPSGIFWSKSEKKTTKIVIIGKGLEYGSLKRSFDSQVLNKKS